MATKAYRPAGHSFKRKELRAFLEEENSSEDNAIKQEATYAVARKNNFFARSDLTLDFIDVDGQPQLQFLPISYKGRELTPEEYAQRLSDFQVRLKKNPSVNEKLSKAVGYEEGTDYLRHLIDVDTYLEGVVGIANLKVSSSDEGTKILPAPNGSKTLTPAQYVDQILSLKIELEDNHPALNRHLNENLHHEDVGIGFLDEYIDEDLYFEGVAAQAGLKPVVDVAGKPRLPAKDYASGEKLDEDDYGDRLVKFTSLLGQHPALENRLEETFEAETECFGIGLIEHLSDPTVYKIEDDGTEAELRVEDTADIHLGVVNDISVNSKGSSIWEGVSYLGSKIKSGWNSFGAKTAAVVAGATVIGGAILGAAVPKYLIDNFLDQGFPIYLTTNPTGDGNDHTGALHSYYWDHGHNDATNNDNFVVTIAWDIPQVGNPQYKSFMVNNGTDGEYSQELWERMDRIGSPYVDQPNGTREYTRGVKIFESGGVVTQVQDIGWLPGYTPPNLTYDNSSVVTGIDANGSFLVDNQIMYIHGGQTHIIYAGMGNGYNWHENGTLVFEGINNQLSKRQGMNLQLMNNPRNTVDGAQSMDDGFGKGIGYFLDWRGIANEPDDVKITRIQDGMPATVNRSGTWGHVFGDMDDAQLINETLAPLADGIDPDSIKLIESDLARYSAAQNLTAMDAVLLDAFGETNLTPYFEAMQNSTKATFLLYGVDSLNETTGVSNETEQSQDLESILNQIKAENNLTSKGNFSGMILAGGYTDQVWVEGPSQIQDTDKMVAGDKNYHNNSAEHTGILKLVYNGSSASYHREGKLAERMSAIFHDNVDPTISFESDTTQQGVQNVSTFFVNASAQDNVEIDEVRIDLYTQAGQLVQSNVTNSTNLAVTYSVPDGDYIVNATTRDGKGLTNKTLDLLYTVDTVAPEVSFGPGTDQDFVNRDYIVAEATANETTLDNIVVRLENHNGTVIAQQISSANFTANFTGLADGQYKLNASANDSFSNIGFAVPVDVYVDTVNPLAKIEVANTTPNGTYEQDYLNINASGEDAVSLDRIIAEVYNATSGQLIASQQNATNFTANFTGLADGVWDYRVSSIDEAGNIDSTENWTAVLDNNAPVLIVEGDTTQAGNVSQNYLFTNISAQDAGVIDNIEIRLYDQNNTLLQTQTMYNQTNFAYNFTNLQDAIYKWNASVEDTAGHITNSATQTNKLDTLAPVVNLNPDTTAAGNLSQNSIFVNVSAADDFGVDNVEIRLYNQAGNLIQAVNSTNADFSHNFTNLTDGVYQFNATAKDNSHESVTQTIVTRLDNQAPVTQFESPTPLDGIYSQSSIELNASATDVTLDQVLLEVRNATTNALVGQTTNPPANITGLLDGDYWVNLTADDDAGNVAPVKSRFVTLDTLGPGLQYNFDTTPQGSFNQSFIYANLSASDLHLDTTTIELRNQSGALINSVTSNSTNPSAIFSGLQDDIYFLNASSLDVVGNPSNLLSRQISIDSKSPSVQIDQNSTSGLQSQNYIEVNASAVDVNLDQITARLYNATGQIISSQTVPANFTGLADGDYSWDILASDTAGHATITGQTSSTLDTLSPQVQHVAGTTPGGSMNQTYIESNVTASDLHLGTVEHRLYSQGVLVRYHQGQGYVNFTNLPDGQYELNASAIDQALNAQITSTLLYGIDTVGPGPDFEPDSTTEGIHNQSNIFVNASSQATDLNQILTQVRNATSGTLVGQSTSQTNNFTGLVDGEYIVNLTADDTVGNWGPTNSRAISLDTLAPGLQWEQGTTSAGTIGQNYIEANISASDLHLDKVRVELRNQTGSLIGFQEASASNLYHLFPNLQDDHYFLNVTALDDALNQATQLSREFDVDTNSPVFNSIGGTDAGFHAQTFIEANASAQDADLTSVTARLYNTSTGQLVSSQTVPANFTGLADGPYDLNFSALDGFGHETLTSTKNIILDNLAPQIQWLPGTSPETNISLDYLVGNLSASDINLENVTLNLYNATGGLVASRFVTGNQILGVFNNLTDGPYSMNGTAFDKAGNQANLTTLNQGIDTSKPIPSFDQGTTPAGINNQDYLRLIGSATDNDLDSILLEVFNNTGSLVATRANTTGNVIDDNITGLAPGLYTGILTGTDSATNADLAQRTWLLTNQTQSNGTNTTADQLPPSIVYEPDTMLPGQYNQSNIEINATAQDETKIVWVRNEVYNQSGSLVAFEETQAENVTNLHSNFTGLDNDTYFFQSKTSDGTNTNVTLPRIVKLGFEPQNQTQNGTNQSQPDLIRPDIFLEADSTQAGTLDQNYIFANVTAQDETGLDKVIVEIRDTQGNVINSTEYAANNATSFNVAHNFTGLQNSTYLLLARALDENNENFTTPRIIRLGIDNNTTIEDPDLIDPSIQIGSDSTPANTPLDQNYIFVNATAQDETGLDKVVFELRNASGGLVERIESDANNALTHNLVHNFTQYQDGRSLENETYQLALFAHDKDNINVETYAVQLGLEQNNTQTPRDDISPSLEWLLDSTPSGESNQNFIFGNVSAQDNVGLDNVTISLFGPNDVFETQTINASGLISANASYNFTQLDNGTYIMQAVTYDLAGNPTIIQRAITLGLDVEIIYENNTVYENNTINNTIEVPGNTTYLPGNETTIEVPVETVPDWIYLLGLGGLGIGFIGRSLMGGDATGDSTGTKKKRRAGTTSTDQTTTTAAPATTAAPTTPAEPAPAAPARPVRLDADNPSLRTVTGSATAAADDAGSRLRRARGK